MFANGFDLRCAAWQVHHSCGWASSLRKKKARTRS